MTFMTRPRVRLAHGDGNGFPEVDGLHAPHHAVRGLHGHAFHAPFAQVLFDLRDDVNGLRNIKALGSDPQGVIDGRKMRAVKRRHHDRAGDLHHFANVLLCNHESSLRYDKSRESRVEG